MTDYADDLPIVAKIKTRNQLEDMLNESTSNVAKWLLLEKKLNFSSGKTELVLLVGKRNTEKIEIVIVVEIQSQEALKIPWGDVR